MKNLQEMVDGCYQEFISDESIVGFSGLLKSKGLGSKRIIKLRNMIYEKYGKQKLIDIYRNRVAKLGGKSCVGHLVSEETRQKISQSNKQSWDEDNGIRRELSRQLMIKNCLPYAQMDEVKKKRVESRKWYRHTPETIEKIRKSNQGRKLTEEHKQKLRKHRIRRGVPHNDKTKKMLSLITKQQWIDGIHKPKYQSKGHAEVLSILDGLGYTTQSEYMVNGKPYDVFIKEKNILIEFNGTFWHRDPRITKYKLDPLTEKIWKYDKEKIDSAKSSGYDVRVVWQLDWEKCQDKKEYIKNILC